jgi:hypothetical protein
MSKTNRDKDRSNGLKQKEWEKRILYRETEGKLRGRERKTENDSIKKSTSKYETKEEMKAKEIQTIKMHQKQEKKQGEGYTKIWKELGDTKVMRETTRSETEHTKDEMDNFGN